MSELKPCPFCGSNSIYYNNDERGSSWVGCSECTAQVSLPIYSGNPALFWNKRASEDLSDMLLKAADRIVQLEENSIPKAEIEKLITDKSFDADNWNKVILVKDLQDLINKGKDNELPVFEGF